MKQVVAGAVAFLAALGTGCGGNIAGEVEQRSTSASIPQPENAPILSGPLPEPNQISTQAIPASHPRIWYSVDPQAPGYTRLQRARQWRAAGNEVPIPSASSSPSAHFRARALRSLLSNHVDSAECDAAVNWLRNFTIDTSQVSSDAARWYGEDAILVYDWCHHRLTASDRTALISRWNNYISVLNAKAWGGPSMPSNNYFWGYLRNSLLWGLATSGENVMADGFLRDAMQTRYFDATRAGSNNPGSFSRWFEAHGEGGLALEGTQYGPYVFAYAATAFTAATDYGFDLWSQVPYWKQAPFALMYQATPTPTLGRDGQAAKFDAFPFNDDEFFREGGSAERSAYADFMATMALRFPAEPVARIARDWIARVPSGMSWWINAEYRSVANAAPPVALPTDYYAAGSGFMFSTSGQGDAQARVLFQLSGTDSYAESNERKMAGGGVGHSHYDAGTFQIWRKGRWLSRETTGYGDADGIVGWNGSGVVNPLEAVAHNGLLFEGRGHIGQYKAKPTTLRLRSSAEYSYAAVDLSSAYRFPIVNQWEARYDWPYAERIVREFLYLRRLECVVVLDRAVSGSDSLHEWYNDTRFRGPRISGSQVRKTFVIHAGGSSANGANPWFHFGNRSTALVGTQAMDVVSHVANNAERRIVSEAGPIGQYRLEVTSSGEEQTTFLHTICLRDADQEATSVTYSQEGEHHVLTLEASGKSNAVVRFARPIDQVGGLISVSAGAAHPLPMQVEQMEFSNGVPVWPADGAPVRLNGAQPLIPGAGGTSSSPVRALSRPVSARSQNGLGVRHASSSRGPATSR